MVLISHKYKFIFIKNFKVAGTSVEAFFQKYCVDDEETYQMTHCTDEIICKNGIVGYRGTNSKGKKYRNHMGIQKIKELHPDCFKSYFKFCIVRNPFDLVVSAYFFKKKKNLSFEQFVEKLKDNFNWGRMSIDGKLQMDYYIKYENLQEDIEKVCKILNIKNYNLDSLPNYKSGLRTDTDYKKFYNNKTRKIVENLFEKQLKTFGYTF
jgi:hypothetical protein